MSCYDSERIHVGWGESDVTPDKKVMLAGGSADLSEGINDRLKVTAMAVVGEDSGECAVFVSCDRVSVPSGILESCRETIKNRIPGLNPLNIIMNATHTHSAPRIVGENMLAVPDGIMFPEEYAGIFVRGAVDAACRAWEDRRPSGISYGMGFAVVGYNRRVAFSNGIRKMYAITDDPLFSHIEGYEDHSIDLLFVWDENDNLRGVVINLACPSQETESVPLVSSDFWHEAKEEVRKELGENLFILAQCAPAGDQSPHRPQLYQRAVTRMLELKGISMRREIGKRVAAAVKDVLPPARKDMKREMVFKHICKRINLPKWIIPDEVYDHARSEYDRLEKETPVSDSDRMRRSGRMGRCRRLMRRYEGQSGEKALPMELHVIRLGDIAFATNSFELFLDFGLRIKARSRAVQTFLIQLAAGVPGGWYSTSSGGYLPSLRAVKGCPAENPSELPYDDGSPASGARGYGAGIGSCQVGPEGGQVIVEETVKVIEELWHD